MINKFLSIGAKEFSDYSRGDMPWKVAESDEELDYEFVFYRNSEYTIRKYDE